MNEVVEEQILAAAESERRNRLRAVFSRLAASPDDKQDVSFAHEAQSEIVLTEN